MKQELTDKQKVELKKYLNKCKKENEKRWKPKEEKYTNEDMDELQERWRSFTKKTYLLGGFLGFLAGMTLGYLIFA